MEGEQRLTSELMWRATLVVAVLDAPLLILLGRGVSRSLFQKLKWHLVGATVISGMPVAESERSRPDRLSA
jgi:hypothetical protein